MVDTNDNVKRQLANDLLFTNFIFCYLITRDPDYTCNFLEDSNFDPILAEIRKLTANVETILLGVIIPLCQRNSGRLEEADREVLLIPT